MPLYEHNCAHCGATMETVRRIANRNNSLPCPQCGYQTKRVISSKVRRECPAWLDSATDNLRADAKQLVTDRTSFNNYLKKNNLEQTG